MLDRRTALKHLGGAASVLLMSEHLKATGFPTGLAQSAAKATMAPFALSPLPYAYDALEPYIDAQTMQIHHDKHHQAYVNNLNAAVSAHPELAGRSVEDLLIHLNNVPEAARTAVRNQGGGHANHTLFWQILGKGSAAPAGGLAKAIDAKFGSFSAFQDKLTTAALGVFGSGWAWLSKLPDGSVTIESTANQDSPLSNGHQPLLALDVWEHAYYLKYQNKRADYVKAFLQVVKWDAVSARFAVKA